MFEDDFPGLFEGYMSAALAAHFNMVPFGQIAGPLTTYGTVEAMVTSAASSDRSWVVLSDVNDDPTGIILDRISYDITLEHSEGGFGFYLIDGYAGFVNAEQYLWDVPPLFFVTTPPPVPPTFTVTPAGG